MSFRGSEAQRGEPGTYNHRPVSIGSGLSSLRSDPRNDSILKDGTRTLAHELFATCSPVPTLGSSPDGRLLIMLRRGGPARLRSHRDRFGTLRSADARGSRASY